jgi:diguanylate cyclase (GGDEF)-like protein
MPSVTIAGPALLAVATVAMVFAIVQLRTDALEDARRNIANLALVLGEQTGRSVQAVDIVLRDLQDSIGRRHGDSIESFDRVAGSDVLQRELADKIARLPQADALSIIDSRGRLASVSRATHNIGLDVSDRDFFRHFSAHDDSNLFISEPTKNRSTGTWMIYFARRINSSRGDFLGVVLGGVPIRYFEDIFRSIDLPRAQSFVLARRDGMALVRHPGTLRYVGQTVPASSPWHDLVAQGGGYWVAPGYFDGIARMVAVRPLRDFPLVVSSGVTEGAALATWRRQAIFMGTGSFLVFAYAAYLMRVMRRQFLRLNESRAALRGQNASLKQLSDELLSSKSHLGELAHELKVTLETMDQGLIMVDGAGVVVQCNTQARRLLDLPDAYVAARPTFDAVLEYQWYTNGSGREDGSFEVFARKRRVADRPYVQEIKRPDGRIIEVRSIPIVAGGFVRTYTDITERKGVEAKVHYLAHHDDLTQLVNRVAFRERLQQVLTMARASGRGAAVLYLDLDDFKTINDTRGHVAGDRVLAEAAQRMRASVRAVDTVARLGGDEFAIILPFLESKGPAEHLAQRLVATLAEPYVVDDAPSCIGVSIGIAVFPQDGADVDELLHHADGALYHAKRAGRNTFRFDSGSEARRETYA